LEVNLKRTKYMLLSCYQSAGQNYNMKSKTDHLNMLQAQFKYLGIIVTNENLIQKEIKRRLDLANACYHLVQNIVFSSPV
jgi:hypothetical protein